MSSYFQNTRFFFERVIGGVFNLGIKMCVISFICYVATPLLTKMVENMTMENSIHENIVLGLACMSGCYTIWMLANKAPQLVSGLLNGSPSMSRGDLLTPARQVSNVTSTAVNTGASIAGTISAANNSEGGYNDLRAQGKGRLASMVGTLGNLKDYAGTQMPGARAWNTAQYNYRQTMAQKKENDFIRKMGNKPELDANGQPVIDEKTGKPKTMTWKPRSQSEEDYIRRQEAPKIEARQRQEMYDTTKSAVRDALKEPNIPQNNPNRGGGSSS